MNSQQMRDQLQIDGRVWLRQALSDAELATLRDLSTLDGRPGARVAGNDPLCHSVKNLRVGRDINQLWPGMRPVRLVSFDKSDTANWGVPWHQDRVIEVADHTPLDGYDNWSQKAGTWHCEPPLEQLETMLFVRVHLDRNRAENGAMEIALGSHREGKVPSKRAAEIAQTYPTEITTAEAGDVLILAMLTLHRSSPNRSRENRRALRIDYAPSDLPQGLNWAI